MSSFGRGGRRCASGKTGIGIRFNAISVFAYHRCLNRTNFDSNCLQYFGDGFEICREFGGATNQAFSFVKFQWFR
jgi:hypothetical protein